ncbi:MAG TPA: pantothenate kinase [Cyanothece sp. UBA12306]|nr:pantothenate kinase [Cyanothece sp. UBA12306]
MNPSNSSQWLALVIGNSRFHWGYFEGATLQKSWDTPHLTTRSITQTIPNSLLIPEVPNNLPIYLASVVPSQTKLWQNYPKLNLITLEQIPLKKLYPTLGIDRALAVLGSGEKYGFPCLVIDAGTALTFTGVDNNSTLVGGAILPGLTLQLQVLANKTAALPQTNLPFNLPSRWSTTTPEAIQSGIIYTILAGVESFIEDWLEKFPTSRVVLTGGDSCFLVDYLQSNNTSLLDYISQDDNLMFEGIKSVSIY